MDKQEQLKLISVPKLCMIIFWIKILAVNGKHYRLWEEVMIQRLKSLFKKRSMFSTFLLYYAIILIIPTAIGLISYFKAESIVREEMKNYSDAMLHQSQRVIDERLKNVQQMAINIAMETEISWVSNLGSNMGPDGIYSMSKIIKTLSNAKSTNKFIEMIYIHLKKSGIILKDNSGIYFTDKFYYNESHYSQWSLEEWKNKLTSNINGVYEPVQTLDFPQEDKEVLTYFEALPLGSQSEEDDKLVVVLDRDILDDVMYNTNISGKGAVYILDNQGREIYYSGDKSLISKNDMVGNSKGNNYIVNTINGREVMISSVQSTATGWQYVSVTPTSAYMNKIYSIRTIAVTILAGGILAGIILSIIFSIRNIKPIRRVVNRLLDVNQGSFDRYGAVNEMDLIEKVASNSIEQNRIFKEELKEQRPLLQAGLINKLLIMDNGNMENVISALKNSGIVFHDKLFCVICISIDQYGTENAEEDWELMKFCIINVLEDVGREYGNILSWDSGTDKIACIFNIKDGNIQYESVLKDMLEFTKGIMEKEFSITISAGIGNVYEGALGIPVSYKESAKALEYKVFMGNGSVIHYLNITEVGHKYYYPIELEIQLIGCLKQGDEKKAYNILDGIINQNFVELQLSFEMSRCLLFEIMSTAVKVLNDFKINSEDIFGKGFLPFERLLECKSITEVTSTIKFIYGRICRNITDNQKSHNTLLKARILKYVDENYMDANIGLVSAADAFNMNSNYLSYFFKEQTGESFSDYIRKKKTDKIKELLTTSDISLEEISKVMNYGNSGVLIRNFKKETGITPGQFRTMYGKV